VLAAVNALVVALGEVNAADLTNGESVVWLDVAEGETGFVPKDVAGSDTAAAASDADL
jgi:hypothetical protein